MRKTLCFIISALIVMLLPFSCFAYDMGDLATMQALALYSATENGNTINISQDGVLVSDRSVTVTFSSDDLVSGSSELTFVAYKPQDDDGTPTKDNIYYLNQIVYNNGTFTFPISSQAPTGIYVLLIGGDDFSAAARVTFAIGIEADLVIGDVNNDSVLNTLDVIKLKYYLAGVEDVTNLWTERDEYAADFNDDGNVTLTDVTEMKKAIANRTLD